MPPRDRANVIVVEIDSLRFDGRFENGLDPTITPTLARLAGQGVAFSNFRTCSPRTHESVPDLLGASASFSRTSGENAIDALARRGVHTTFVASDWVARYASVSGFTARRMPRARYGQFADDEVVHQALAFLADRPAEPFFLFTHWLGAHEPYDGDAACLASAASDRARYACALAALDRKLGSLYAVLRTRGLAERTVLAVSADHGEEFGEHGGRFHATTLYDEVLRVPMFLLAHGRAPALVKNPLGCRDFLPTVLGAANYPEGISPYGHDVLGPDSPGWFPQVARTRRPDERSRFEPRVHAVVDRGHKLLFDGASGVLVYFDLERDPAERVPLRSAPPAVERELIALMDAWLSDQAEVHPNTSASGLAAR
jgi:arylsulfatase A-like enzyme